MFLVGRWGACFSFADRGNVSCLQMGGMFLVVRWDMFLVGRWGHVSCRHMGGMFLVGRWVGGMFPVGRWGARFMLVDGCASHWVCSSSLGYIMLVYAGYVALWK